MSATSVAAGTTDLIQCRSCTYKGPQDSFPQKRRGNGYLKACTSCTQKQDQYTATHHTKRKVKEGTETEKPASNTGLKINSREPMPWTTLLPKLEGLKTKACEVDVFVNLDPTHLGANTKKDRRRRAAALVADIRKMTGYSFNYHEKTENSRTTTLFEYFCSQRDGRQTKPTVCTENPDAQRDREYMSRFPCGGCLRITIDDDLPFRPRVRLVHRLPHIPWVDIGPSKEITDYISDNKRLNPSRLWKEIRLRWPETEMTAKQVGNHWSKANEGVWKLDEDQVKSAKLLVEQVAGKDLEIVALHAEPGMSAIAFSLKEPLEEWGEETAEIAFDGTFNTNAAHYEISGLIAEGKGQGIPLGFIYTVGTDGTAKTGAKMRLLIDFLEFFRQRCPRIKFTLTDKERAEIEAFRKVWPEAKHQCCYWHAVRYIETRLSENKPPGPYDARAAWREFDFIDPTWVPGVVASEEDARNEMESGSALPKGQEDEKKELEFMKQAVATTCRPPVFVLIKGDRRIPVWPNPPSVPKKDLPTFCPKEYRTPIVEKFRRHFCHHPLIPLNDADGTCLSAEEIHEAAVYDMYRYCRQNDLSQVWAYIWTCWYAPERWKLWARSASPLISRMRTTMMVEGFWRLFKHNILASFSRPRLDLVTYLIITEVLPSVKRKLDHILGRRRVGRPHALSPWSKEAKSVWTDQSKSDSARRAKKEKKLLSANPKTASAKKRREQQLEWLREEAEQGEGQYRTALLNWTCSCSSYLLSRYLFCKHLIREANAKLGTNRPGLAFFKKLQRFHTRPFYRIAGIHVRDPAASKGPYYAGLIQQPVEDIQDDQISETESGAPSDSDIASNSDDDDSEEAGAGTEDEIKDHKPSLGDEGYPLGTIEDGAGRVHFSSVEQEHHIGNFNFIATRYITDPQGLSPGLKRRLDRVLADVNGLVGDAREDEARRKRRRTWDSGRSMFIGNE
ncbi:hypothetical protein FRC04_007517 [Tulasnella sp. 424]|nr:hypothetical protein FRC04_007517 [Tulasnella sp. 424]KAG8959638.1 hypothetical protein FRC05_007602 [Tulasnella sp. 425]